MVKDPNSASRQIYGNYVWNAAHRGLAFELSYEELLELINADCTYCGERPSRIKKRGKHRYTFNGIDRVDNDKGYVEGNVVTCCSICNRAKYTLECADFEAWIERLMECQSNRQKV